MEYNILKIVITGGCGFIGSHLAEYWASQNAEIHVIDNLRSGDKANLTGIPNVTHHFGSITDKELICKVIEGADYVFNFAALVSVPESVEKPMECIDINAKGLINLLEAAKKHNVKKLVHSSSAAVYGDDAELPNRISLRPNPKSPYGITKLDGEYYCNFYRGEFGVNAVSLRYFNVFGPRQNPKSQYAAAVPIFISKAIANEEITIYGDGEQTRDFIFVKDIVKANVLAATTPEAKGVYNVANGKTLTINNLAKKIIEITNSESKIVYKPERAGDIKYSLAAIDETIDELGFTPSENLDNELKQTIEYFINNGA